MCCHGDRYIGYGMSILSLDCWIFNQVFNENPGY